MDKLIVMGFEKLQRYHWLQQWIAKQSLFMNRKQENEKNDSIFSLSVKGEMLEDNIDDKHFSILDVLAEFDKTPQENRTHVCAQVALSLVGNFPSKVPLYHACYPRGFVEKTRQQNLTVKVTKRVQRWCSDAWKKQQEVLIIRSSGQLGKEHPNYR